MLPRPRLIIVAIFVVLAIISTVTALVSVAPGADIAAGRRKAEACVPCHGAAGNAITPGTPSLAGMPPFYTHWQLIMYRDGRRRDAQMSPFAINLTDADMARAAAGRPLAQSFHCGSCHGPQLMGQNQVARLAGQDFDYLLKRLRGYKAKTTSDLDGMMTMVAQSLSEEDIQNLVHFMAGAAPTPASAGGDGR
jgi:cytochrome c553